MSAPKNIVWREERWPNQWIGMHIAHPGGTRCNSRQEAERFMRNLCSRFGCDWMEAYQ